MGIESRIVSPQEFIPLYPPYSTRCEYDRPSELRILSRYDHKYNLTPDLLADRYTWSCGKYSPQYLMSLSRYWDKLSGVQRWAEGDIPVRSGFSENDAEHTAECVKMVKSYAEQSPNLSRIFNFTDAAIMATFHDGGEIELGDVAISSKATKYPPHIKAAQELAALKNTVLADFPDQERIEITEYASRYLKREESWMDGRPDPEAEFTKLVDIAQGVKTAIENFYPNPQQVGDHDNKNIVAIRVHDSVVRLFTKINALDTALFARNSGKMASAAFSEWRRIIVNLVRPLITAAYINFSMNIVEKKLPSMLALLQEITAAEESEIWSGTAYPLTDSRMI